VPGIWFFSTEPEVFPWWEVEKVGRALWDGIRGTAARKWMREIEPGDAVWGYHSSPEKAVVCRARAASAARPDPKDPDWLALDVRFEARLPLPIPLAVMRAERALSAMKFLRQSRLSISPVTPAENRILMDLAVP
jgi:predicted RNA-binding protein with PUA-like domain